MFIKPLTATVDVSGFSCGSTEDELDLANFLKEDAIRYRKEGLAYTSLLFNDSEDLIAYFSLATDVIKLNPQERWLSPRILGKARDKKLPEEVPAIKLCRLAVHEAFKGQGAGRLIMDHILATAARIEDQGVSVAFITVDAIEQAVGFYEHFKFVHNQHPKYRKRSSRRHITVSMRYPLPLRTA